MSEAKEISMCCNAPVIATDHEHELYRCVRCGKLSDRTWTPGLWEEMGRELEAMGDE